MQYCYVLLLQKNNFYIGWTRNIKKRLFDHFNKPTTKWVRKYKPIKVIEIVKNANKTIEKQLLIKYQNIYGKNNCRGAHVTAVNYYELNPHLL